MSKVSITALFLAKHAHAQEHHLFVARGPRHYSIYLSAHLSFERMSGPRCWWATQPALRRLRATLVLARGRRLAFGDEESEQVAHREDGV